MDETLLSETDSAGRTSAGPQSHPVQPSAPSGRLAPQEGPGGNGCGCGGNGAQGFVYAIGNVVAKFPSLSVEKEFWQTVSESDTKGVPDDALLYQVLSQGQNLYLAREMCWVFRAADVDVYIVRPRSYVELNDLIGAIKPSGGSVGYDLIVGVRGGIAPASACNGLQLPTVTADQVYSFSYDEFIDSVVKATGADRGIVGAMFSEMLQIADNTGEADEHRALNYVTMRYMGIYKMADDMAGNSGQGTYTLRGVTAEPSRVPGARKIIDVIFTYAERVTGEVVKWYVRVDVTGEFPFLVSKLARYYN